MQLQYWSAVDAPGADDLELRQLDGTSQFEVVLKSADHEIGIWLQRSIPEQVIPVVGLPDVDIRLNIRDMDFDRDFDVVIRDQETGHISAQLLEDGQPVSAVDYGVVPMDWRFDSVRNAGSGSDPVSRFEFSKRVDTVEYMAHWTPTEGLWEVSIREIVSPPSFPREPIVIDAPAIVADAPGLPELPDTATVKVADLNQDGRLDAVVHDPATGDVMAYINVADDDVRAVSLTAGITDARLIEVTPFTTVSQLVFRSPESGFVSTLTVQVVSEGEPRVESFWENLGVVPNQWQLVPMATDLVHTRYGVSLTWYDPDEQRVAVWRRPVGLLYQTGSGMSWTEIGAAPMPTAPTIVDFDKDGRLDFIWRSDTEPDVLWHEFISQEFALTSARYGVYEFDALPTTTEVVLIVRDGVESSLIDPNRLDDEGPHYWVLRDPDTGHIAVQAFVDSQMTGWVDYGVVPLEYELSGVSDLDGDDPTFKFERQGFGYAWSPVSGEWRETGPLLSFWLGSDPDFVTPSRS